MFNIDEINFLKSQRIQFSLSVTETSGIELYILLRITCDFVTDEKGQDFKYERIWDV